MTAVDDVTGGRYRLLIDAVTDYAIYMLDPDRNVVSWNPGARRFKGYQDHEIIGHHFSRFYTPEDKSTELPARALVVGSLIGAAVVGAWACAPVAAAANARPVPAAPTSLRREMEFES